MPILTLLQLKVKVSFSCRVTFVSFYSKLCIHHIICICIHIVLRLDWNKAMIKLVADWANNKRFDEFVELEKNVKSYVDNNIPWLRLETVNHSNENILMQHFPYENIISRFVRYSISASSAEDNASTDKIDKQALKSAMGDIQKRMETLATAGKLLESLSTFETEHTLSDSYNKCCTNCFRMVVSGWFILFRQHKALIECCRYFEHNFTTQDSPRC